MTTPNTPPPDAAVPPAERWLAQQAERRARALGSPDLAAEFDSLAEQAAAVAGAQLTDRIAGLMVDAYGIGRGKRDPLASERLAGIARAWHRDACGCISAGCNRRAVIQHYVGEAGEATTAAVQDAADLLGQVARSGFLTDAEQVACRDVRAGLDRVADQALYSPAGLPIRMSRRLEVLLEGFEARHSADLAQHELDLIHLACGAQVTMIEHEDTAATLVRMAEDHVCSTPEGTDD